MTYSCVDFTDSIIDALNLDIPEEAWDEPSAQADLALAEIEALQAKAAAVPDMLAALKAARDAWHANGRNFYRKEPEWLPLARAAIAKVEAADAVPDEHRDSKPDIPAGQE